MTTPIIRNSPHLNQRIAARRYQGGLVRCRHHAGGRYSPKPANWRGPEGCPGCKRAMERMKAIREWLRERGELS